MSAGIPGNYLCIIFQCFLPNMEQMHNTFNFFSTHCVLFLLCREDSHNHSSGPISRTDEQSLLSRILHQTAQYVILVECISLSLNIMSNLLDRKNDWSIYYIHVISECLQAKWYNFITRLLFILRQTLLLSQYHKVIMICANNAPFI